MRVLYLAYPDPNTRNEVYLTEKFISALNNCEVQNYVCRRKPSTYTKALHIANEETSFILMDLATHAPGGLQAPIPGNTSFIAVLKARHTESRRSSAPWRKCYYCDKEGHFKERCPTRLKDFLKQRADKGNCRSGRPTTPTGNPNFRTASPAARKKQVKFADASQTLPVVAESYGRRRVAAIADEVEPVDVPDGQDLLADIDLATLDKATVAALYEELQQLDLLDDKLDFPDG